jgi:hypothetical protein
MAKFKGAPQKVNILSFFKKADPAARPGTTSPSGATGALQNCSSRGAGLSPDSGTSSECGKVTKSVETHSFFKKVNPVACDYGDGKTHGVAPSMDATPKKAIPTNTAKVKRGMDMKPTALQRQSFLLQISETRPRDATHSIPDSIVEHFPVHQSLSSTENTREFLEDESEDEHQDRIEEIKDLLNQHRSLQTEQVATRVKDENALFDDFELPEDSVEGQEHEKISLPNLYDYDSDGERVPFYPFKQPETFTCPFEVLGECPKPAKLKNARSVALHVKQKHPGVTIETYEHNPLEDGTAKVPCPKLCGRLFSSHHAANDHAKNPTHCDRPEIDTYPRRCPWNELPDVECVEVHANAQGAKQHAAVHVHDKRGPFQCHKCDEYWADLYLLASHIDRCSTFVRAPHARTCLRIELNDSSDMATTLLVARSSGPAPSSWLSGLEWIEEGLPVYGTTRMRDYENDFGLERMSAVFHAAASVSSRNLPAPSHQINTSVTSEALQSQLSRAWKMTDGIEEDLKAMASQNPGVKTTLVSVGLDGFACHTPMILPFLKRVPEFVWVIRETELCHGMDEKFFPQYPSGLHYGVFESADILAGIEAKKTDPAVQNLLQAWKKLQACKDLKVGRRIGRNGDHRHVFKPDIKKTKLDAFLHSS